MYYVPSQKKLNLSFLAMLINERSEHNLKIIQELSGQKKKIFYPFGYTGAGKTTFILYSYDVELREIPDSGAFEAAGEIPAPLKELVIGQSMKSQTVFITASVHEGWVFLDGPGLGDTGGPAIDIANIVSCSQIFEKVPQMAPLVFIEYVQFHTMKGQMIRKLLASLAKMFSDDIETLEKHMIVVFTKIPKNIKLEVLQTKIEEVKDVDADDNTQVVKELLDFISCGLQSIIKKNNKLPLAGRVIIFRPEEGNSTKIRSCFNNSPQLQNPKEVFKTSLEEGSRLALQESLHELQTQIPVWLKEGHTTQLAEHLVLLKKLSFCIPDVESTLAHASKGLHHSVCENLASGKEFLELVLQEGVVVSDISRFTDARKLLASIESLREFMPPLEELSALDTWTVTKLTQLEHGIKASDNFSKYGATLQKFKDLASSFQYLLPSYNDIYDRCRSYVQTKVEELKERVEKVELTPDTVNQLHQDLLGLIAAGQQVQPFLSFNCKQPVDDAIISINESLDKMVTQIIQFAQNKPVEANKSLISDFKTIKLVCAKKSLAALLNVVAVAAVNSTEDDDDITLSFLSNSQVIQKIGAETRAAQRFLRVRDECVKCANDAIEQLKTVTGKEDGALDALNETYLLNAKALESLDKSIQEAISLDLNKAIISLENHVDSLLIDLKNIILRPQGPDFTAVPNILKDLEACKWVDKYTFNPKRVQIKTEEAIKVLNDSLKALSSKIRSYFLRNKFEEVEKQFSSFEENLSGLSKALPQYELEKKEITTYLVQELNNTYSYAEQKIGLKASSTFTFPEGDQYLERLSAISSLAISLGLQVEHERIKNRVIRYFKDLSKSMVEDIITSQKPYPWRDFNKSLNQLQPIRSKTEYPNFDDEIRSAYDQAVLQCKTKIQDLKKEAENCVQDSLLADSGPLLAELQGAIVLVGHIPDVLSDINKVVDSKMQAIRDSSDRIKLFIEGHKYRDALQLLENSLKPAANEPATNAYKNSLLNIKNSFADEQDSLRKTITFYKVFISEEDKENKAKFDSLIHQVSDFESFHNIFVRTIVNDDKSFDGAVPPIYAKLDQKFLDELNELSRQKTDTDLGMQKASKRISFVEGLITIAESNSSLHHDSLPKSRAKALELRNLTQESWNSILAQLKAPEENIVDIDTFYESYSKEGGTKAGVLKQAFLSSVAQMIHLEPEDTLSQAKEKLMKVRKMATQAFNTELRQIASDAETKATEAVKKLDQEKSHQFETLLRTWDFEKMRSFFKENQFDKELLRLANEKLNIVSRTLICSPNSLNSLEGLQTYCENLNHLLKLDKTFPGIVQSSSLAEQIKHLKMRANTKIEEINAVFVTGLKPSNQQLLTLASSLLDLTMMGHISEVVTIKQLEDAVQPILQLFSKNKLDLESAVGRCEFHNIFEALKYFQLCDPLLTRLKALEKSQGPHDFVVLRTTITSIFDYSRAIQDVGTWLGGIQKKVQTHWERKEFTQIHKILRAIQVCNPGSLEGLFPSIISVVDSIVLFINSTYDELSKRTFAQLEGEDWSGFRTNLSVLNSLHEIEVAIDKKATAQLKSTIEQKIINIKDRANLTDRKSVADALVNLNQLSLNIPQFKDRIQILSVDLITEYGSSENGDDKIYELGVVLYATEGPRARNAKDVVASIKHFSAVSNKMRQEATAKQTIEWALGYWGDRYDLDTNGCNTAPAEISDIPRFLYTDSFTNTSGVWESCVEYGKSFLGSKAKTLLRNYNDFKKAFDFLYDKSIVSGIPHIVVDAKALFVPLSSVGRRLVEILAHICVVWSRLKSVQSKGKNQFRLTPHPIQVLCFFRLLEGSPKEGYFNQLIEVLTGEGKSVVLGIVATYFGLLGYDVYSICYSSYLSTRDYQDFVEVFETFGIKDKIVYSTIAEMCEITINQTGSVRDLTKAVIESATKPTTKIKSLNPYRVLLIDEVDVFFGADFYGNTYNPATMVSNEHTYELLNFIYSNRTTVKIEAVIQTQYYKNLTELFPQLRQLFDHEIRKMLKDVKKFEETPEKPIIMKDIIYYNDQDTITCKKAYGYKTCFQYFQKFTEGEINDLQSVKDHVGMYIGCGNFSFAEIPVDFTYKMGVSGTLQSLTNEEKDIIQGYGIQRLAYAPSIYGGSRCNASSGGRSNITFYDPGNWFLNITQSIGDKIQAGRAVLVFFENFETLSDFADFLNSKNVRFQVLTEKEEFKETIIKQSTASEMVTLCTRPFGRGVDFIVRDPKTKNNGGVHVIQTFVAACEAEQIQIRGRAARQGEPGSHEYILSHPNLKKYLGTTEGQPPNSGFEDFTFDNQLTRNEKDEKITWLRDTLYATQVKELGKKRDNALEAHTFTNLYYKKLLNFEYTPQQRNDIINSLMELNKGSITSAGSIYHLFFCLDESGSMVGSPWADLLDAVTAFINKRIECCNSNGCPVEDLVTVVNYASNARVVFSSQTISPALVSSISFNSGGTNFAAGLMTIKKIIYQSAPQSSGYVPCLIFMSDGGCGNGDKEMVTIIRQNPNIQVFVIGFGSGCDRPRMTRLAEKGKGQFFFGADGSQLKGEFEKVSIQISGGEMAL